ncbi:MULTISPECIES: M23 family metallopeptidase [unclassified Agromyces]|uniref:M23 family metallopeptidase n=1 Tax=unclassified Agromyces TaxID=2639701 RepID=UPI0030148250
MIPAGAPHGPARPSGPRSERPRDLRADSTDDLSAVLAAAANTGLAPAGLEFREFDVEPPRERRTAGEHPVSGPVRGERPVDARPAHPGADRRRPTDGAAHAQGTEPARPFDRRDDATAPDDRRRPVADRPTAPERRPADRPGPFDRPAPRSNGNGRSQDAPGVDVAPAGRVPRPAPVRRPAAAPAAAARPAPRRTLRRAITTRVASSVAMGFVALLAVATSVPSLSLLSPADVQAMALGETTTVTIDGQRVEITGDAAAAAIGREDYQAQTIEEYARAAGIRPEATFTNNPLGTIQWPFAVGVHIGDRFGYRNCAGCSSNHRGQDFNPGDGAEIQSIADGVVSVSTDAGGSLGAVTMIDHVIDGETVTSVYAHMQYGTRRFEVGDTVEVGDVVGNTGNTGMSTGPHLHFEIRIGGVGGTHVDPLEWLWANTN